MKKLITTAVLLLATSTMVVAQPAKPGEGSDDPYSYSCVVTSPTGKVGGGGRFMKGELKNGTRVTLRWWNPGQGKTGIYSGDLNADWVDKNYLTAGFVDRNLLTCDYERDMIPHDALSKAVSDGRYMLQRC